MAEALQIDETHDPAARSWVASANASGTDFPVQNLPFGRYRHSASEPWRVCVAIGDHLLDLQTAGLLSHSDIARVMGLPSQERLALRRALFAGLSQPAAPSAAWHGALQRLDEVELGVPCEIGDYTDFYVGIHHATAVGRQFRPENPLLPNYEWVPIGYHGRASSIVASGRGIPRPHGQVKPADSTRPLARPTDRFDFELELGVFIGPGNALGEPIPIDEAEEHIFGIALFNDWTARYIQAWEYQPLGPFLSKNFASTVSPWIVTTEALAPFRASFNRTANRPQPLPYLGGAANASQSAIDINLEILLQTPHMREAGMPPATISRSNYARAAYWTAAQMVAHHTMNGCNLRTGDLLGTGTLSGEALKQAGSLLELSCGGRAPITLPNGEQRSFLLDGDRLEFRGSCERAGFRRIGFGLCQGEVLPARSSGGGQ